MPRLFDKYLATYNNGNLPNSTKALTKEVQILFWQTLGKATRIGLLKFCQRGKILPNLVTLLLSRSSKGGHCFHYKETSSKVVVE